MGEPRRWRMLRPNQTTRRCRRCEAKGNVVLHEWVESRRLAATQFSMLSSPYFWRRGRTRGQENLNACDIAMPGMTRSVCLLLPLPPLSDRCHCCLSSQHGCGGHPPSRPSESTRPAPLLPPPRPHSGSGLSRTPPIGSAITRCCHTSSGQSTSP